MRAWRDMARNPLMTGLVDDAQTGLRPGGERPQEFCIDGLPNAQYAAIAAHIQQLIAEDNLEARDIAVLSRRKATIERLTNHLDSQDIPHYVIGEDQRRQDPNAQCITAMLTLAVNPANSWSFRKAADCNVTAAQRAQKAVDYITNTTPPTKE